MTDLEGERSRLRVWVDRWIVTAVGAWLERNPVWGALWAAVFTVAGGVLIAAPTLTAARVAFALLAGVLGALPTVITAYWTREKTAIATRALSDATLLSANALGPLMDTVAKYVKASSGDLTFTAIAFQAASSLLVFFPDHLQIRVVAFMVTDDAKGMSHVAHAGRTDLPTDFTFRSTKGRAVKSSWSREGPTIERDMRVNGDQWGGSGENYRSFVSVALRSGDDVYGMLNVDSPNPDAFDESDERVVALTARMLKVAYFARNRE